MVTDMTPDALSAAFRALAIHEGLKLLHAPELSPWVVLCALTLAYAAVRPTLAAIEHQVASDRNSRADRMAVGLAELGR